MNDAAALAFLKLAVAAFEARHPLQPLVGGTRRACSPLCGCLSMDEMRARYPDDFAAAAEEDSKADDELTRLIEWTRDFA